MSKIYITGDIHGYMDFEKIKIFASKYPNLTKEDYLIILGDFGLIWDEKYKQLEEYEQLKTYPWTTLFVDGNHENFSILNSFPITEWNGGKVHKIEDNIIHLMRGQIFTINDSKFFAFGGGYSHDRYRRRKGISWWEEELPSIEEVTEGIKNLEKNNWEVDYVITHDCPRKFGEYFFNNTYIEMDAYKKGTIYTPSLFNHLKEEIKHKVWFNGHLHFDGFFNEDKDQLFLFKEIIEINNGEIVGDINKKEYLYLTPRRK